MNNQIEEAEELSYRSLKAEEIVILEQQGCRSETWEKVLVCHDFGVRYYRNVRFSGDIRLGTAGKDIQRMSVPLKTGIYDAHLHNCTVGDNVYISKVGNYIANYDIDDEAIIENVKTIVVEKQTSFGNGLRISVMNEQGGRSVPIFNNLSAQMAYMMVFYRHRPLLQKKLEQMAEAETVRVSASRGRIGVRVEIVNTGIISDCMIGDGARIFNAERLHDGSINSSLHAPVIIGTGVIANHFIVNSSSQIIERTILSHCFVGEGCILSREFSAENSLFFANFIGHHGEAYAIFAGPHTATFHKSTLLISAYFSFMNAGSGSNQSNHLYKLGPFHQGIMERGTKTSSDSYLLWPARIGAFTIIMGRHMTHCDIGDFPYSYLLEQNNESVLIPAVNMKSVGIIRDADKWKDRDMRSGERRDIINYDLLTPYTVGKMVQGYQILVQLQDKVLYNERIHRYQGVNIPAESIEKGMKYYALGINKYVGDMWIKHLLEKPITSREDLLNRLVFEPGYDQEKWCDLAGCILPQSKVKSLISAIENDELTTVQSVVESFEDLHEKFYLWAWNWVASYLEKIEKQRIQDMTVDTFLSFFERWITATKTLDNFFKQDAQKEFAPHVQIGFGIDGDETVKQADFEAVRGVYADNPFIMKIDEHYSQKEEQYRQVVALFQTYYTPVEDK